MNNLVKKNHFHFILLLILIILSSNLTAESPNPKRVVITEITTDIDGVTKEKSLLKEIQLYEGIEFENYDNLKYFMDEAIQDLINMRVFELADYSLEKISPTGSIVDNYSITIKIKDANNTYFIPLAGYSSNDGFKVALKSNFYNIFGSLIDFKLPTSMYINYNEALNRWDIPAWSIEPSVSGINLIGLDFTLDLRQSYNTEKSYDFSGTLEQQYTYHNTSIEFSSSVPLYRNLTYSFGPSLSFNYNINQIINTNEEPDLDFANLTFSHNIELNKTNWIDNLKEGYSANLANDITASYDIDRTRSYSTSIIAGASYFLYINEYLNLSGRLNGLWSSDEIDLDIYLRGVKSGYLTDYIGAALSIDLTISTLKMDGIFEFQTRPFFDIGIIDEKGQAFNSKEHLAYTTGLDGILYLDKWKSFVIRGTFGIDLNHFNWNNFKKYEIEMSTGLSY